MSAWPNPRAAGAARVRRKFAGACAGEFAQGELCPPEHHKGRAPPHGVSRVGNHAENEFNNRCDELAVMESLKFKE